MIRALLFDCNGVIADDEPIHLRLFQKVMQEEGVRFTTEEYYKKYLAMDDRSCFREVLKSRGLPSSPARVRGLISRKAAYYRKTIDSELKIFPGVRSFIKTHVKQYALAVVSGALRHEIDLILKRGKIRPFFSAVVSSEDVRRGKPDPEGYLNGFKLLNRLPRFRKRPLKAGECLAIEDSIHGIESAHQAGMACLAVTNSYPATKLRRADFVVSSLAGISVSQLE